MSKTIKDYDGTRTLTLSDVVYVVKDANNPHGARYAGARMRAISGVDGNPEPGYHFVLGWITLCPVDADTAQLLGFKRSHVRIERPTKGSRAKKAQS